MLKLESISKTFNPGTINEKKALVGLSLHLEPGEVLLADDAPTTIIEYTKIGGKGVLVDENLKPRQNFPAPIIKEITQLTQFAELF